MCIPVPCWLFPSQILIISVLLHVAQFMQITRAFIDNGLRPEFRRPLGDDILPKRKHYEYKGEPWDAELECRDAEWKARKNRFVSIMKETSQCHLVDTLIANVTFAAGFIGQEGPHLGSAVLTSNTAFKSFIITNTIAMVQYFSAAFIQLFMPLLLSSRQRSWRLFFPTCLTGLLPFHICHGSNVAGICFGHMRCVNAFLGSCHCEFCHRILLLHPPLFRRLSHFLNCIVYRCEVICEYILNFYRRN